MVVRTFHLLSLRGKVADSARAQRSKFSHLRLSTKLARLEFLAPVLDTKDSVARNCICATSTNANVADGWRSPLEARAGIASPGPCFRHAPPQGKKQPSMLCWTICRACALEPQRPWATQQPLGSGLASWFDPHCTLSENAKALPLGWQSEIGLRLKYT